MQRQNQGRPDAIGKLHFQRPTLAEIYNQLEDAGGDEIICNIAAWRNGEFITVEVSPEFAPYQRQTSRHGLFGEIFEDDDDE